MHSIFSVLTLVLTITVSAQTANEIKLQKIYLEKLGENALLYNGVQFYGYDPGIKGTAFYLDDSWKNASLIYNGTHYHKINLRYDLVKQQLLVNYPGLIQPIILVTKNVNSFSFNGITFKKITNSESKDVKDGFYEVLIKDSVSLFTHRLKVIRKNPTPHGLDQWFETQDRYVIQAGTKLFPIENKRSLYKAFPLHKSQLKKFLKKNNYKIRSNPELALKAVVRYLNEMKPN